MARLGHGDATHPLPKPSKVFHQFTNGKKECTLRYVCIAPSGEKIHKSIENIAKKHAKNMQHFVSKCLPKWLFLIILFKAMSVS